MKIKTEFLKPDCLLGRIYQIGERANNLIISFGKHYLRQAIILIISTTKLASHLLIQNRHKRITILSMYTQICLNILQKFMNIFIYNISYIRIFSLSYFNNSIFIPSFSCDIPCLNFFTLVCKLCYRNKICLITFHYLN